MAHFCDIMRSESGQHFQPTQSPSEDYLDRPFQHFRSSDLLADFRTFRELLADPWFTSLWTLQESFIMGEAVLMGGMDLCVVPEGQLFTLYHLGVLAVDYSNLVRDQTDENMKHLYDEFEQAWPRSGLQGGSQGASPMAVLASSSFRATEFELDRVYGVMQIFGDEFRVGKARTDLDAAAEQSFTLLELEDALGALVIQSHPAVSQLFYHESAPRAGGAWRIRGAAAVPSQLSAAWGHFGYLDAFDSQCRLSIRVEGGTTWAWFEAKTCPLERMVNCYRLLPSRYTEHPNYMRLNCWFDAGPQSPCSKEGRDRMQNIYRFEDIGRETLVSFYLQHGVKVSSSLRYTDFYYSDQARRP